MCGLCSPYFLGTLFAGFRSFRLKPTASQMLSLKKAFFSTSREFIIARFSKVPLRLFRLSNSAKRIVIREKVAQEKKGVYMYDYVASPNGNIEPAPPCNTFIGPNGLSMRPSGRLMYELVAFKKGSTTRVIEIPEGAEVPQGLVLLHEHTDHYSLQPSRLMTPAEFIALVGMFVKPFRLLTQDEYVKAYPYINGDRESLLK